MNTSYTPGPWTAGKQIIEDEFNVPYVSIRENQKHIAMVTYGMPQEMHANARLIAAAPELLAALMRARDHVVMQGTVQTDRDEALAQIRSAIYKATGK